MGACVVVYGNSVFLAGIGVYLEACRELELITVEPALRDPAAAIGGLRPAAVLFDLAALPPAAALGLLRACPGSLLVGVDPSSDELLLLSSRQRQAGSVADLEHILTSRLPGAVPTAPVQDEVGRTRARRGIVARRADGATRAARPAAGRRTSISE